MIKHKSKHFTGKVLTCHEDFKPFLEQLDVKLAELNLKIYVTSSLRKDANVKGAIVTPAKRSNHMVGFAFDCNIIDGSTWWNSKKLVNPSGKVLEFIEFAKSIGLRWGGDFSDPDPVHFDYPINRLNPNKWNSIFRLS